MPPTDASAATTEKRPPLLVHLLFHPDSESGRELALAIHDALNGDPVVPGLRVPTSFVPLTEDGKCPVGLGTGGLDLDQAERSFVVALADRDLNLDAEWRRFAADTWQKCEGKKHRFLPFQLSPLAYPLDPRLAGLSFARAYAEPGEEQHSWVIRRLLTELCRYLEGESLGTERSPEAPIKLFLSHTKMDLKEEPEVIESLKAFLNADQPIKVWYDAADIGIGSRFAKAIEDGIEDTSLLCVQTNHYASREWCREEILLAKEKKRPIVVIDALSRREVRSFPYLGNLPVLRWNDKPEEAVDLVLKESLRHLHVTLLLESERLANDEISIRPPELLTLTDLPRGSIVLYPDPPLGQEEKKRIAKLGIAVTTPLERSLGERSLEKLKVALSMSESTDVHHFGFGGVHLELAMLELTRSLLLRGARLVYGGHLGSDGYTEKLVEIVRAHNQREDLAPVELIENYVGWPIPVSKNLRERYLGKADLELIPRPEGVDERLHEDFEAEPNFFPGDKSPIHRYAWARGMTAMREVQTAMASARIVLGGVFGPTRGVRPDGTVDEKWYYGRIPGVLEEAMLSIEVGQPVFLIGAFGGVGRLLVDLLEGLDRHEMSWDYQKNAPCAPEMRRIYEERGDAWVGYGDMIRQLREKGIEHINPLLEPDEHRDLFYTRDVTRMARLIARGLGRAAAS